MSQAQANENEEREVIEAIVQLMPAPFRERLRVTLENPRVDNFGSSDPEIIRLAEKLRSIRDRRP